jgi:hypothetical protein
MPTWQAVDDIGNLGGAAVNHQCDSDYEDDGFSH